MTKTTPRRPTLAEAKARFVHRFTMEHTPAWARDPRPDGTYYAPNFRSDAEWYENTLFHGESDLATKRSCFTTNLTWPLGQVLSSPYRRT